MNRPLVSVAVTTFNSAAYVVETLDSIKNQDYPNIELIISDDCSSDDTLRICRSWLAENKERFIRTEVIGVPQNTGVSANCNRCIAAARAEWIKFIAGDDILFTNCIADNMAFVQRNPGVRILFSGVRVYRDHFREDAFLKMVPNGFPMNLMHPDYSAEDQFRLLLLSDRITYTPSYFFNKGAMQSVGGYDEKNRLVEDYPMWLKLTKRGIRLFYMDRPTVGYRQHHQAQNNMATQTLFKPLFLKMHAFRCEHVYPSLPWDIVWTEKHTVYVSRIFQFLGLNKDLPFHRRFYRLLTIYMNPFRYIHYVKKKLKNRNELVGRF